MLFLVGCNLFGAKPDIDCGVLEQFCDCFTLVPFGCLLIVGGDSADLRDHSVFQGITHPQGP